MGDSLEAGRIATNAEPEEVERAAAGASGRSRWAHRGCWCSFLKKRQRENPVFNDDQPVQPDDADALQDLIDAIQSIALAGCIDELTDTYPDEAELFRLRYLQGRSVAETSQTPRFK